MNLQYRRDGQEQRKAGKSEDRSYQKAKSKPKPNKK